MLVDYIYKRSRAERNKVFDRDFFVVGDFNIEAAGDEFFNALTAKGFEMPPGMENLHTNFLRNHTFDKIAWVGKRASFEFAGQYNVVPFGEAVFQDTRPKGGKSKISDHLPLWAEFKINKLSQELDQILNR